MSPRRRVRPRRAAGPALENEMPDTKPNARWAVTELTRTQVCTGCDTEVADTFVPAPGGLARTSPPHSRYCRQDEFVPVDVESFLRSLGAS